jgi:tetratricopeptide (TPR) repeat protein
MDFPRLLTLLVVAGLAFAADPAYDPLSRGYEALRARQYDSAISFFQAALEKAPDRTSIHKDLGYTYLKVGETARARDHFAEAMRLDPADEHVALEYAFLCYETKQQANARRVFDRIRRRGNATAERAFQNIERELSAGIARWSRAVELSPDSFSAHRELAGLAEQRDDLALSAKHYRRAWELRPDLRSFLLDLGRVWKLQGDAERANGALLAASRGAEPRVAERARELLPSRYPYVYEFQAALDLDPGNVPLRRELAYLHLEMGQAAAAEAQFRRIVEAEPDDALSMAQLGFLLLGREQREEAIPILEKALEKADDEVADRIRSALGRPQVLRKRADVPGPQTGAEARDLAARSLEAGYLKDAVKYLRIAHENDPLDFNLMLRLGWTYNILQDDRQAIDWFRLARKSPDPKVASEASRAYENLRPAFARIRTTTWFYPMYSTRWKDLFTYAQFKTELMPNWPVHVYLSARFAGDTRRTLAPLFDAGGPQYLSESAGIFGLGVSTQTWRGARAWFESGIAASYLRRADTGRTEADHRGGISFLRSFGRNLGPSSKGLFAETSADAIYVSRFDQDTIAYLRGRTGYTLKSAGPIQFQLGWAVNTSTDVRRYQWANTFETGPAVRIRFQALAQPFILSVEALDGRYTVLDGTRPARYSDIRIGLWYAFTR